MDDVGGEYNRVMENGRLRKRMRERKRGNNEISGRGRNREAE